MEEDGTPESDDELFGFNLRKMREKAGMSQAALAEAMQKRGRPWHQSTVYRVESGRQPVPFWEARDLSAIFRVALERFTWKPADANAADALYMSAERVRLQAIQLIKAVGSLQSAIGLAERAQEDTAKYASRRVDDARENLARILDTHDLVTVVNEGLRRHAERFGSSEEGDGDDGDAESEPGIVDQQRA